MTGGCTLAPHRRAGALEGQGPHGDPSPHARASTRTRCAICSTCRGIALARRSARRWDARMASTRTAMRSISRMSTSPSTLRRPKRRSISRSPRGRRRRWCRQRRISLANPAGFVAHVIMNGDGVLLKDKKPDPEFPPAGEQTHIDQGAHERMGSFDHGSTVGLFRHEDESLSPYFMDHVTIYPGTYRVRDVALELPVGQGPGAAFAGHRGGAGSRSCNSLATGAAASTPAMCSAITMRRRSSRRSTKSSRG